MAGWTVDDLGKGTYLFRWESGFYISPFAVTTDGVVAVDPINREAARAYREAVASVTSQPIGQVVYSHDHRDHIVGADVLAPQATILAHPRASQRIAHRKDSDIPPPDRQIDDGDTIEAGDTTIEVRYFGPNHSDSNIALYFPTDAGTLCYFCDIVEPDIAPYRELPDTDFGGLLETLDRLDETDFTRILGGHAGPAGREWVTSYRGYFADLLAATRQAWQASGGQVPLPGEDGVAMTERVRVATCQAAADAIRDRYAGWRGFDAWSPKNADRILSYLITGN